MGAGAFEVRGDVAWNLSTTTCNRSPEVLAIALNFATTLSRPQPTPRCGSSPDEIESRVPQDTSSSMVARSDFLLTLVRAILPAGGGSSFTAGCFPGGSAGSWSASGDPNVGTIGAQSGKKIRKAEMIKVSGERFICRFIFCSVGLD